MLKVILLVLILQIVKIPGVKERLFSSQLTATTATQLLYIGENSSSQENSVNSHSYMNTIVEYLARIHFCKLMLVC